MKKPTDLGNLYPDPWGHLDDLEDRRMFRVVTIVSRVVSVFIGAGMLMLLYTGWEWLHP